MKINNKIKDVSIIAILCSIIALANFYFGYISCLFNMKFSSIAITPNIAKAIEIQNFVESLDYKHSYVSIEHFDNKYLLAPNFTSEDIKRFDYLTIKLAESDIVDDSVIIGFDYKDTKNKRHSKKRIEKAIERRLKKVDSVISVKSSVKYENNEMYINVDVDISRNNKRNIENIISKLVPVDKKHKTINVNYIQ